MEKKVQTFSEDRNGIRKILIRSILSIFITLIGLICFSILLTYTQIQEGLIPTVTIIITAVSILIGSTISTGNLKKNGIINGTIIGLIYILTIYILSSIIEKDFSLNMYSIIMIIISSIFGAIGGIIGVNK